MNAFLLMLVGHALADYPLQGDYLAQAKNRASPLGAGGIWLHALTAHAAIHGGFVGVITGVWWLGVAEAVAHAITDTLKCEGRISYHTDQAIHIACKALWAFIAWGLAA